MLQESLPVCPRPFAFLADKLNTDEETVLNRLRYLKEVGYLRRIGTFFDSNKLGYVGTLIALRVNDEYLSAVAQAVNHYPGVTHNYEREGEYNLWFTLMSPNEETERNILSEIASLPGVEAQLNLKAKKKYKINVQFALK
ncbi:MAG: Lrp/AsnC family transcriptional regulator [Selenomonadaceae bacterium]|nr:Lrp/AsnC family transcriptional regulator [Selenomonadaceae bacterium]